MATEIVGAIRHGPVFAKRDAGRFQAYRGISYYGRELAMTRCFPAIAAGMPRRISGLPRRSATLPMLSQSAHDGDDDAR